MRKSVHGIVLTFATILASLPWGSLGNLDVYSDDQLANLLKDMEYQEEFRNGLEYDEYRNVEPDYYQQYEDGQILFPKQEMEQNTFVPAETRQSEILQHGTPFDKIVGPPKIDKITGAYGQASRGSGPILPAYCDPPNPCPIGYTEKDGCIEDFENTSEFSRRYQSQQNCLCDSEHMFNCPANDPEPKQNQGPFLGDLPPPTLETGNPYLDGQKLHIAAKKGLGF